MTRSMDRDQTEVPFLRMPFVMKHVRQRRFYRYYSPVRLTTMSKKDAARQVAPRCRCSLRLLPLPLRLRRRERAFTAGFLIHLNASQAAIRAGYRPTNARAQASRLLTKANIQGGA